MKHLFAKVASTGYPSLDGIVLFHLEDLLGSSYFLEIRYSDFLRLECIGDRMHLEPLELVMAEAELTYGIHRADWRALTDEEAAAIDASIG